MKRKVLIFTLLLATAFIALPGESFGADRSKDRNAVYEYGGGQDWRWQRQRRSRRGRDRDRRWRNTRGYRNYGQYRSYRGYRNYGQYRRTQVGNRRYRMVRRPYWNGGRRYTRVVRVYY